MLCFGCATHRSKDAIKFVEFSNNSNTVIQKPSVTLTIDPIDNSNIIINYPPQINPEQYEWRAEVSPDLKRWFYFYQLDTNTVINFPLFKPNTYIRLVGIPLN